MTERRLRAGGRGTVETPQLWLRTYYHYKETLFLNKRKAPRRRPRGLGEVAEGKAAYRWLSFMRELSFLRMLSSALASSSVLFSSAQSSNNALPKCMY